MTHARHKAPSRSQVTLAALRRGRPRSASVGSLLLGTAMLGTAATGATLDSASRDAELAALADAGSVVTSLEIDEIKSLRQDALLQSARSSDRWAFDIAPPRTVSKLTAVAAAQPVVAPLPATTAAFTTQGVNVRAGASKEAPLLASLDVGTEVAVTGTTVGDYAEIVFQGQLAWVYAGYVSATPPTAKESESAPASGVSGEPCAAGSGVESGLSSNAIAVHRAVCALFPQVSSYGGLRRGDSGEHGTGHALDIMISSDVGTEIAAYLQAHAGELGVTELIWRQRIWTTDRAGDGWRGMSDRGSSTANHFDHVHVTVR